MDNKNTVLAAIKQLGHKVSVADIAAKTGLSLFEARQSLNKIALDTRAVLEVSPGGELSYKFYPDLESVYRVVGLRKLLKDVFDICFDAGFYILKISFGILLMASIITIMIVFAVALVFILFGIGAADAADGDMDMDLGGLDFEFFDWDELGMFFAWSTLAGARTPTDGQDEYMGVKIDSPDKGFFQNCFSFLFGEGNPNKPLKETQWQLIAEQIRRNNGVVTAEQLAPYLLNNKSDSQSMLAVMVRFDGSPEVTERGNIVYRFPSLQVTASGINSLMPLPDKLVEADWKFSRVPTERLHWVFFFAGANLCGAYALNQHLSWFQPLIPYANQIHLILCYAAFFMGFPILRELGNIVQNTLIEIRNKSRARSAEALKNAENLAKIREAQEHAVQLQKLYAQQAVYTTSEDILPQDTDGLAQQFDQIQQSPARFTVQQQQSV
ncbi:MAG: hypothetical protein K2X27_05600 [Candidatus Obscuribacterales bacterium]|nr:hypothetical protein [Candidatus Obscuribacterales bacterium]